MKKIFIILTAVILTAAMLAGIVVHAEETISEVQKEMADEEYITTSAETEEKESVKPDSVETLTRSGDSEIADCNKGAYQRAVYNGGVNNVPYSDSQEIYVDPATGSVNARVTDLVLPGKGGFDLNITRRYNSMEATFECPEIWMLERQEIPRTLGTRTLGTRGHWGHWGRTLFVSFPLRQAIWTRTFFGIILLTPKETKTVDSKRNQRF